MNNKFKRIVSLVLVLVMAVSLFSVCAFAKEKKYSYYTVLGDSNASGYGTDAYFVNAGSKEKVKEGDLITGTYPAIIAEALGLTEDQVNVRSHSGWRTNEFLHEIKPDTYKSYDNFFRRALNFVTEDSLKGEGDRIIKAIKKSDLITVNFGSNDIYSYTFSGMSGHISDIFPDVPKAALLAKDPVEYIAQLLKFADVMGMLDEFIDMLKGYLDQYSESFLKNMPKVLKEIRNINGDKNATIVVLGVFCPISLDFRINHELVYDFRSSSDERVADINAKLKKICDDYNCVFVDVSKTETYGLPALDVTKLIPFDSDIKYSAVKMAHPTEEGHQYMAKQILTKLGVQPAASAPVVSSSRTPIFKSTVLKWTKADGAMSYRVYRADSPDGEFKLIGTTFMNFYLDIAGFGGKTYYYKVAAVNSFGGGESVTSKVIKT